MSNKIVLVGFMGCGKSTIGKMISEMRQIPFWDTDEWIEHQQKKSITEIFHTDGEERFREMETECLEHFQQEAGKLVLATGGGLPEGGSNPTFSRWRGEKNRKMLKDLGKVFYLSVTPQEVFQRLRQDTTRPLLQVENPMEEIRRLMERREAYYAQCADYRVEVSDRTKEEIVEEILEKCERGETK